MVQRVKLLHRYKRSMLVTVVIIFLCGGGKGSFPLSPQVDETLLLLYGTSLVVTMHA